MPETLSTPPGRALRAAPIRVSSVCAALLPGGAFGGALARRVFSN